MGFASNYTVTEVLDSNWLNGNLPKFLIEEGVEPSILKSPPNQSSYILLFKNVKTNYQWYGVFSPDLKYKSTTDHWVSCPNPDEVLVVVGFEIYFGDVNHPKSFRLICPSPGTVYSFPDCGVLAIAGDSDLHCITSAGSLWKIENLTYGEIFVEACKNGIIYGNGAKVGDPDRTRLAFEIDIQSGEILKGLSCATVHLF